MSVMELDIPAAPRFIPCLPAALWVQTKSARTGATGELGRADGKRQQRADLEQFCSQEGAFSKFFGRNEKKKQQKNKKPTLVFHIIPLGAILCHFAENWICLPKSSTAIGSARVWSAVAATLTFPLPHPLPTHPLPLVFSFMWIYLCLI